jgi:hypothetical protein
MFHAEVAMRLNETRRAELIAEAAHDRLVREAKKAARGRTGQRRTARRRFATGSVARAQ